MLQEVRISDIKIKNYIRAISSEEHILDLESSIKRYVTENNISILDDRFRELSKVFGPIRVTKLDGELVLVDGYHRLEAYKRVIKTLTSNIEDQTIFVEFVPTQNVIEHIEKSVSYNKHYALKLNNADKYTIFDQIYENYLNMYMNSDAINAFKELTDFVEEIKNDTSLGRDIINGLSYLSALNIISKEPDIFTYGFLDYLFRTKPILNSISVFYTHVFNNMDKFKEFIRNNFQYLHRNTQLYRFILVQVLVYAKKSYEEIKKEYETVNQEENVKVREIKSSTLLIRRVRDLSRKLDILHSELREYVKNNEIDDKLYSELDELMDKLYGLHAYLVDLLKQEGEHNE